MRRNFAVFLLVASAMILAAFAQPLAAAPVRTHRSTHLKAHPTSRAAGKSTSTARAHARSAALKAPRSAHLKSKVAEAMPLHGRARVHGVGVSRNARLTPAVMRTRRGARTARRHAHFDDNPPRLQQVRLAMPAPLRGSHESLVHQNEMAQADGLERILDDDDLADRISHGSLVRVPLSGALRINTDLPENRRYCRPWTAKFLADLATAHAVKFGGSLEVTSAVRTVEYQRHLRLFNGNAAAADGDVASPHLTGGTIDLAKQGMTSREIGWLRAWLIPLEQAGKIDVEEEFKQSCFHISVYRNYLGPVPASAQPQSSVASASMLAARSR